MAGIKLINEVGHWLLGEIKSMRIKFARFFLVSLTVFLCLSLLLERAAIG